MRWVGNDVVCLEDPANQRSPLREGYMEKCCTQAEIVWVIGQSDRVAAFWQLWAAKEAAYKIGMKMGERYHLQPRRLEVFPASNYPAEEGKVHTPFGTVQVWWMVDPTFIHAIATVDVDRRYVVPVIFPLGHSDESDLSRERLLDGVVRFYGLSRPALSLNWIDQKIPQLCYQGKSMDIDCSISHDGPWGGYVFTTYAQGSTHL